MSDELPEIVRLRSGGVGWYEESLPPLREIDVLLRELAEIEPGNGRDAIRLRAAQKVYRVLTLAAKHVSDAEIREAIFDALRRRLLGWDPDARSEVLRLVREIRPIARDY